MTFKVGYSELLFYEINRYMFIDYQQHSIFHKTKHLLQGCCGPFIIGYISVIFFDNKVKEGSTLGMCYQKQQHWYI